MRKSCIVYLCGGMPQIVLQNICWRKTLRHAEVLEINAYFDCESRDSGSRE
jgi:hypothetical protein